jgi:hypothetical protein
MELPRTVELRPFPEVVIREAPELRSYQFCLKGDDVVLVDPREHRILEIIE